MAPLPGLKGFELINILTKERKDNLDIFSLFYIRNAQKQFYSSGRISHYSFRELNGYMIFDTNVSN